MWKKHNVQLYSGMIVAVSFVVISVIVFSFKQQSFADWVEDVDGVRYEQEDGQYAVGFSDIDGQRYYFDTDGYLVKGKFYIEEEDAYYYSDKNGILQIGVIQTKSSFYITEDTGKLQTGFVEYENQRYYFDEKVKLVKGWFKVTDDWYYADDYGVIMTGFVDLDGYRYYLNADGTRVSDTTITIDGITYVFNRDGSVDENATVLYPVYEFLNQIRAANGKNSLELNSKVQSCAILRASELVNGYLQMQDSSLVLVSVLQSRGVQCNGGYELSYGGVSEYGIDRLISDMHKDYNLTEVLKEDSVAEVGLGMFEQDGIFYYDIILVIP